MSMETLSYITCPACPSCSGGIYLIYDDDTTSSIPPSANASEIEAELLRLSSLGSASVYGKPTSLNVSMEGGWSLCEPGAQVSTSIKIRCPYGNLPSFTLINSITDGDGETVSVELTDGKGDKEDEYCSNHGVCDFGTGMCLCDRNTTFFPDEWYWWESSDGYGGSGGRPDCGYQRKESATNVSQGCPVGVVFTDATIPTYEPVDQARDREREMVGRGGSEGVKRKATTC